MAEKVRHIGFDAAVKHCMENSNYTEEQCRAAVAAAARGASARAKRHNPRLRRVKG